MEKGKQLLIIRMHFCWSFGLFEIANVPSSSSVVVHDFHEDDSVFANVMEVEGKFYSTQVHDVDVHKPLN